MTTLIIFAAGLWVLLQGDVVFIHRDADINGYPGRTTTVHLTTFGRRFFLIAVTLAVIAQVAVMVIAVTR